MRTLILFGLVVLAAAALAGTAGWRSGTRRRCPWYRRRRRGDVQARTGGGVRRTRGAPRDRRSAGARLRRRPGRRRAAGGIRPTRPDDPATTGRLRPPGARGRVAGTRADRRHHRRARLGAAAAGAPPHAGRAVLAEVHRARGVCPRRRAPLLGRFGDLPRVHYWMVWNEPNFSWYLVPAAGGGAAGLARVVPRDGERRSPPRFIPCGGTTSWSQAGSRPYGTTNPNARRRPRRSSFCGRCSACPTGRSRSAPARSEATFDVWSHHPLHERRADARGGPPGRRVARATSTQMAAVLPARRSASGRSGRRAASGSG